MQPFARADGPLGYVLIFSSPREERLGTFGREMVPVPYFYFLFFFVGHSSTISYLTR
jgi:hypothetical protein